MLGRFRFLVDECACTICSNATRTFMAFFFNIITGSTTQLICQVFAPVSSACGCHAINPWRVMNSWMMKMLKRWKDRILIDIKLHLLVVV